MELILALCGALIAGIFIGWFAFHRSTIGKLHIIRDEDDEAYMFLELDVSVENIASKKYARFKVTQK